MKPNHIYSAFVLTLAAAVCIAAAPAMAETHGVGLVVRNQGSPDFCMDASLDHNAEGREAYIYKCHGRYNQRWAFTWATTGNSAIVGFDGRCLDIRGRKVGDNTPVELWNCHYGANQEFAVTPTGEIREVQSGKCLTIGSQPADRRPVFIDECDGNPKQLWTIARQL